ncbi:hypothetical protein V5799_004777 [Amblyomma americanum]|uniref:Uncharacterized protein n=1 Tax=Amblyomma americanum TaxID=6943 RepID=A0AAQ4D551_AMBAM
MVSWPVTTARIALLPLAHTQLETRTCVLITTELQVGRHFYVRGLPRRRRDVAADSKSPGSYEQEHCTLAIAVDFTLRACRVVINVSPAQRKSVNKIFDTLSGTVAECHFISRS